MKRSETGENKINCANIFLKAGNCCCCSDVWLNLKNTLGVFGKCFYAWNPMTSSKIFSQWFSIRISSSFIWFYRFQIAMNDWIKFIVWFAFYVSTNLSPSCLHRSFSTQFYTGIWIFCIACLQHRTKFFFSIIIILYSSYGVIY